MFYHQKINVLVWLLTSSAAVLAQGPSSSSTGGGSSASSTSIARTTTAVPTSTTTAVSLIPSVRPSSVSLPPPVLPTSSPSPLPPLPPRNTSALNINEPPDGKVYFAAWLDTADSRPGANDGDRPTKFNSRMGFNASVWQYAQDMPIPAGSFPFPEEQVYATGTDALIFLTVYPRPNPWSITDDDIRNLTRLCGRLNRAGRKVFIRFGPEMNGNWNYWGQQPTRFNALWRRVTTYLREDAPDTAMVWAPSSGNGYPYGGGGGASAEDRALLDTNRDGAITPADDPYLPYYPGDDYVDWVGLSIYHYGTSYPWEDNSEAPPGKFEAIFNVGGFYQTFSVARNKPYMIAEHGASFHTDTPRGPGVGELAVKQPWWRQYLTNRTFWSAYPKAKLHCLFEFLKFEETTMRDFRISMNDSVRSAFLADFRANRMDEVYIFGQYVTDPANVTGSPNGSGGGNGNSRNSAVSLFSSALLSGVILSIVTSHFLIHQWI